MQSSEHNTYQVSDLRPKFPFPRHSLPMDYSAKIDEERKMWTGIARVPADYFPPNVNRWNAYAIHGTDESRT